MFGLSANESFALGIVALWVYSAAVGALPEPTEKSGQFYQWAYKFLKIIAGDLSAKFGQYIPKAAAILVIGFSLVFAQPVYSQTSTTTTTTTSTSNGLSASSDVNAIYFDSTWGTGTHIAESLDIADWGSTKANHFYLEGHELLATTAGFTIYAGGGAVEPDLSKALKHLNYTSDNIKLKVYAALGNGVPTSGNSHISALAGGVLSYRASSALTWNALQANWIRFGPKNGASISTGLLYIFGK